MARSGRDKPKQPDKKPRAQVVDERPIDRRFPRSKERGNPNIPIRTIMYVEVGDMSPKEVATAVGYIQQQHANNEHPHYVLPTRDGRINTELMFEGEFLKVVQEVCEVQDGEIVLKDGGAREVEVIRKRVQ